MRTPHDLGSLAYFLCDAGAVAYDPQTQMRRVVGNGDPEPKYFSHSWSCGCCAKLSKGGIRRPLSGHADPGLRGPADYQSHPVPLACRVSKNDAFHIPRRGRRLPVNMM